MVKIIRWTKEADESFLEMIDFIRVVWNDKIVERFVRETFDVLDAISESPELYAARGRKKVRRVVIHPNVSLIYKINADHIDLLLFLDNRRKPIKRKF